MAESQAKPPSLEEEYSLVKPEDKPNNTDISEEKSSTTTEDKTETVTTDSVQEEKLPEATVETVTEEEKLPEETTEEKTTEETNPVVEEENTQESEEEKPEIKIETAPADFRFPTTNQTRHCFTRYVEYHKCVAAKGEDAPECDKFAKYYRSLCPSEWVERWNEQRENGTFPGPL